MTIRVRSYKFESSTITCPHCGQDMELNSEWFVHPESDTCTWSGQSPHVGQVAMAIATKKVAQAKLAKQRQQLGSPKAARQATAESRWISNTAEKYD